MVFSLTHLRKSLDNCFKSRGSAFCNWQDVNLEFQKVEFQLVDSFLSALKAENAESYFYAMQRAFSKFDEFKLFLSNYNKKDKLNTALLTGKLECELSEPSQMESLHNRTLYLTRGVIGFKVEEMIFLSDHPSVTEVTDYLPADTGYGGIIAYNKMNDRQNRTDTNYSEHDNYYANKVKSGDVTVEGDLFWMFAAHSSLIDCYTFALHTPDKIALDGAVWYIKDNMNACDYRETGATDYNYFACSEPSQHLQREYKIIDPRSDKIKKGDRIFYLKFRSAEGIVSSKEKPAIYPYNNSFAIVHTGIVTALDENGLPSEAISKFGSGPVIRSDPFKNRTDYGSLFIIARGK